MERATISFPVPLSPRISTGCVLCAALAMMRYNFSISGARPTMLPKPILDLIFSRSVRFSVFNRKWPATRSSSSLSSSMLKGLVT